MTANNGWPGKPGVPLNPEKDGWHCVLGHSPADKPRPELWSRDQAGFFWWSGMQWREDKAAKHWTYLGPVLLPDEATALQKRVAELERALDAAARVLHKAGEQFSEYAKLHAAKGTAVSDLKAAANKQWAELCFSAYWRAVEGGKDE